MTYTNSERSDFIDFLSALMGARMFNHFQDIEETWKWTFKSCMDFLERAKMVRIDDRYTWRFIRCSFLALL